jgi:hypothetical protein
MAPGAHTKHFASAQGLWSPFSPLFVWPWRQIPGNGIILNKRNINVSGFHFNGSEEAMENISRKEDMPDPDSAVCQLMQSKLECHMAEFNPRLLKELEDSGQLQEYLRDQSSQARLIYLQCRKAGMSPQKAGEVADQDLCPALETSEGDDDPE